MKIKLKAWAILDPMRKKPYLDSRDGYEVYPTKSKAQDHFQKDWDDLLVKCEIIYTIPKNEKRIPSKK